MTGGDEEAAERLHRMIRPFVLRRLKKDVLTDLPDKIEKNMVAVLEDEQSSLYDAHVQRLLAVLSKQTEQEFAGKRSRYWRSLPSCGRFAVTRPAF